MQTENFHFLNISCSHSESDDSPGMYLRDDFLGRPTELRAPTAERAALFLDLALSGRAQGSSNFEPALIYTLHVYQYSLSGKRGGKSAFGPEFNKIQFYGLADVLNLASS